MLDREQTRRDEHSIEQIAMEWKMVAKTGFEDCKVLLLQGFVGYAGEVYRKRLNDVLVSMEKTANMLWEGTRL